MLVRGESNLTILTARWRVSRGVMGRLRTIQAFGGDLGHSRLLSLGVRPLFYEAFTAFMYNHGNVPRYLILCPFLSCCCVSWKVRFHIFWLHLQGGFQRFFVSGVVQVLTVRTNSCNLQGCTLSSVRRNTSHDWLTDASSITIQIPRASKLKETAQSVDNVYTRRPAFSLLNSAS